MEELVKKWLQNYNSKSQYDNLMTIDTFFSNKLIMF